MHPDFEPILDPALLPDFEFFSPFLHPIQLVHLEFESCHLAGIDFLGFGFWRLLNRDPGLSQHSLAEIVCEFDLLLQISVAPGLGRFLFL